MPSHGPLASLAFMFLRIKPSVRFALSATRSIYGFHESLLEISTPRYLVQVTVSRTWPCNVQLTLAISNSLISNNRLSRSENLVPA